MSEAQRELRGSLEQLRVAALAGFARRRNVSLAPTTLRTLVASLGLPRAAELVAVVANVPPSLRPLVVRWLIGRPRPGPR